MVTSWFVQNHERTVFSPNSIFPEHISLDNYIAVFKAQPFGLYLYNSFVIALLGTVLVVVASAMASYSLARIPIKGKNWY